MPGEVLSPPPINDSLPEVQQYIQNSGVVAENGSVPDVYIRIIRAGFDDEVYQIQPTTFEYVSSVEKADMVQFTVVDSDLEWINNKIFTEDLKTEVHFKFGYPSTGIMSDTKKLIFYRQAPKFPEGGAIETTITAYDKLIVLALPASPRMAASSEGLTLKDMVNIILQDYRTFFPDTLKNLTVDFGNGDWTNKKFRFHMAKGSAWEFLMYLRNEVETLHSGGQYAIEVFVDNDTVFFRPKGKDANPVAVYYYALGVLGHPLLSFEPQVQITASRQTVRGTDPTSGRPTEDTASPSEASDAKGNKTLMPTVAGVVGLNAESGAVGIVHKAKGGPQGDDVPTPYTQEKFDVTYTVGESDLSPAGLNGIAQRYNTTTDAIIAANPGLNPTAPHLALGQQLSIPVKTLQLAEQPISTLQGRMKAALSYLFEEDQNVEAKATVLGDPRLKAGMVIGIYNVGVKWQGKWYIEEVKHTLNDSGYKCDLDLSRDGFPIGQGMDRKSGASHEGVTAVENIDQAASNPGQVKLNVESGAAHVLPGTKAPSTKKTTP